MKSHIILIAALVLLTIIEIGESRAAYYGNAGYGRNDYGSYMKGYRYGYGEKKIANPQEANDVPAELKDDAPKEHLKAQGESRAAYYGNAGYGRNDYGSYMKGYRYGYGEKKIANPQEANDVPAELKDDAPKEHLKAQGESRAAYYGKAGYGRNDYGSYMKGYRYGYGEKKIASRQGANDVAAELKDDAPKEHLKAQGETRAAYYGKAGYGRNDYGSYMKGYRYGYGEKKIASSQGTNNAPAELKDDAPIEHLKAQLKSTHD